VQHNLGTLNPQITFYVTSGSKSFANPGILDSNNIELTWYGPAIVAVVATVPSVSVNTAAAYNASALPTGGLVEYWPCNDGSGTSLANSATTSNPMTLSAGAYGWGAVTGFPGSALTLTATTGETPPAANIINPLSDINPETSPFSAAAWVLVTDTASGDGRTIIGNGRFNLDAQQGSLVLNVSGANRNLNHASITGTLTHVAITYDGSGSLADPHLIYYINGVAIANAFGAGGTIGAGTSSVYGIGAHYSGPTGQPMTVAGVGIWNRALQPFELAQIYALGTP